MKISTIVCVILVAIAILPFVFPLPIISVVLFLTNKKQYNNILGSTLALLYTLIFRFILNDWLIDFRTLGAGSTLSEVASFLASWVIGAYVIASYYAIFRKLGEKQIA